MHQKISEQNERVKWSLVGEFTLNKLGLAGWLGGKGCLWLYSCHNSGRSDRVFQDCIFCFCVVRRCEPLGQAGGGTVVFGKSLSRLPHGDTQKGDLNLESLGFELGQAESFEKWVLVHDKVEAGEMPPKKKRARNRMKWTRFSIPSRQRLAKRIVIVWPRPGGPRFDA